VSEPGPRDPRTILDSGPSASGVARHRAGGSSRWCARVVVAFALALCAAGVAPASRAAAPAAVRAPGFHLPQRAGGEVVLDSLRGQVVVLDFWASWCGPCRSSFPWLADLQKRHADRGVKVVAVNLDKTRALADDFLAHFPAPFTVAFDPAGRTAAEYHVEAMPTTFLIDRDGTILVRHVGFDARRNQALETRIQEVCSR
jgi:cytochrome c biogenesis protein CcmG, thiol:disulfide interchange protein DsbE